MNNKKQKERREKKATTSTKNEAAMCDKRLSTVNFNNVCVCAEEERKKCNNRITTKTEHVCLSMSEN